MLRDPDHREGHEDPILRVEMKGHEGAGGGGQLHAQMILAGIEAGSLAVERGVFDVQGGICEGG